MDHSVRFELLAGLGAPAAQDPLAGLRFRVQASAGASASRPVWTAPLTP